MSLLTQPDQPRSRLPSGFIAKLASDLPGLSQALGSTETLYRIISRPAGDVIQHGGGFIGTVRESGGNAFAGPIVWEAAAGGGAAATAGPLVLSVVAAAAYQHALNQISSKIEAVHSDVKKLIAFRNQEIEGELRQIEGRCSELEQLQFLPDGLTDRDAILVDRQLDQAGSRYHELRISLERHKLTIEGIFNDRGGFDSDAFDRSMHDMLDHGLAEVFLFALACRTRLRLTLLREATEIRAHPDRLAKVRDHALADASDMRRDLEVFFPLLNILNVRKATIDNEFEILPIWSGKAKDQLDEYRRLSKPLRALSRRPPDEVLSLLPTGDHYLVEVWREPSGQVGAAYADLSPDIAPS